MPTQGRKSKTVMPERRAVASREEEEGLNHAITVSRAVINNWL